MLDHSFRCLTNRNNELRDLSWQVTQSRDPGLGLWTWPWWRLCCSQSASSVGFSCFTQNVLLTLSSFIIWGQNPCYVFLADCAVAPSWPPSTPPLFLLVFILLRENECFPHYLSDLCSWNLGKPCAKPTGRLLFAPSFLEVQLYKKLYIINIWT